MIASIASDNRIDPDVVHDVLRNDRRRKVLEYLKQRLEPVALRELAERVAARETGESPPPTNIRQSVYNSLHQTHLPKLDDIGVVEYDKDRKRVELRERARQIDPYMDVITRAGVSWSTYYRTIGVVGFFAIVAAEANLPVLASIEPLAFATVFLAILALSTAYQLWSRRWLYLRSLLAQSE